LAHFLNLLQNFKFLQDFLENELKKIKKALRINLLSVNFGESQINLKKD
jgi:hypothetical protein